MLSVLLPIALLAAAAVSPALAFCPPRHHIIANNYCGQLLPQLNGEEQTRSDFISTVSIVSALVIATTPIEPVYARGRATLEYAYDRFTPRIIDGGKFYKSQLSSAIAKSDWKFIKSSTTEPPKKSKEDRALADGGTAKRAALAGGFSDSRVLAAMDLFASDFSDNSISPKTKAMKAEVEKLREVVQELNKAARIALGEEKSGGGGLFGIGGKTPSQSELAKEVQELYLKGGNAYNQYIFVANDGLPVQFGKLPYL
jgi:hypothetical protein